MSAQVYKFYWGALFATLITWIFSVVAATGNGWMSLGGVNVLGFRIGDPICVASAFINEDFEEACSLFRGARACQYIATILVSFILVLVVFAAFQPAPATVKYGPIAGISLLVFSVIQLITFALMAAYIKEYEAFFSDPLDSGGAFGGGSSLFEVKPGPTFAIAVMAFLFGLFSGVVTLVLFKKVASEDGPLRKFQSRSCPAAGPKAGRPAGLVGIPVPF